MRIYMPAEIPGTLLLLFIPLSVIGVFAAIMWGRAVFAGAHSEASAHNKRVEYLNAIATISALVVAIVATGVNALKSNDLERRVLALEQAEDREVGGVTSGGFKEKVSGGKSRRSGDNSSQKSILPDSIQ